MSRTAKRFDAVLLPGQCQQCAAQVLGHARERIDVLQGAISYLKVKRAIYT